MFLLLAKGAVIALCMLLWRVAVYALPVFVGFSVGFWALSLGARIGALAIGVIAGVACWGLAKHVFANGNSMTKTSVGILFALSAGYMGFDIVCQLGALCAVPVPWQTIFALAAGLACSGTLLARLSRILPAETHETPGTEEF